MAGKAKSDDQFLAQFSDWAKGEIEEAAERLQTKSLRKACREKLNFRIAYLNQATERFEAKLGKLARAKARRLKASPR